MSKPYTWTSDGKDGFENLDTFGQREEGVILFTMLLTSNENDEELNKSEYENLTKIYCGEC